MSLWWLFESCYCGVQRFPYSAPLGVEMALALPWPRRHFSNRAEARDSWAF